MCEKIQGGKFKQQHKVYVSMDRLKNIETRKKERKMFTVTERKQITDTTKSIGRSNEA